jgi:hypothetical protein
VGNVLGLSVESRSREEAQACLGTAGPLLRIPIEEQGRVWDDDLAMAMAMGECLAVLPEGATHLDTRAHLEAYLGWLRSGARGIGGLTHEVLLKVLAGEGRSSERVWQARCDRGQRPLGNGAAMRIAPLGVAFAGSPHLIAALVSMRANALEDNLVLWQVLKGKRSSVKWIRNVRTPTGQWHNLKLVVRGRNIEGFVNGKRVLEHTLDHPVCGRGGI